MTIAPSLRRLAGLGLNAEQLAAALTIIADILDDAAVSAGRAMSGAERMRRHRQHQKLDAFEPDSDVRITSDEEVTLSSPIVTPEPDIEADIPLVATASAEAVSEMSRRLAVARRALNLTPGLTRNAVRVAGAILERVNKASGRCDPGLTGIGERLGVSTRHARRGVRELEMAGLFVVRQHGGGDHRNAYLPVWERFEAVTRHWEAGMSGSSLSMRTSVAAEADNGDRIVLQTQKKIHTSTRVVRSNAGARGPDRRQRELLLPMTGGQTAAQQAKVRLILALDAHLLRFGSRFAERTKAELDDAVWDSAVRAEINRRDSGLGVLLETLGPGQATGPPVAGVG